MRGPVDTVVQWWRSSRGHASANASANANGNGNGKGNGNGLVNGNGHSNGNGKRVQAPAEPAWYRQWELHGVPRSLTYPTTTLAKMLDQTAERFADTTAMISHDRQWTYGALRA